MCCADHQRAASAEMIDDGDAERAAFDGIGARPDFVQQHQRRKREVARTAGNYTSAPS